MKFNSLLAFVAFIGLSACNTTGSITNANDLNNITAGDPNITMPKYFFTDEINKTCKMKIYNSNNFYSNTNEGWAIQNGSYLIPKFDLTDQYAYKWLEDLQYYNWKKDHNDRSNSLDVHFRELTNRLEFVNTTLTNSIIDGTMETQAPLAIDLLMTWAEAGVIMDSTSVKEIQEMREAGTFTSCYQGKGNEKAVCHWHTAQEAARYAGQVAIIANMTRPYMNYRHLTITENYLNAMYKKYIQPWYVSSGAGDTDIERGFYQMGHGSISVLAYAHWKNNKKLANYAFNSAFNHIDALIMEEGLINNNSFRGVRGYWYHGTALNNMLAMVALAEEYNYPVADEIYTKLTDAVNFMDRDAEEHLAWLESLPKNNYTDKTYVKWKDKEIYVGNASWDHKNARNYMKNSAVFLDYLSETYTKGIINKERKEYKIFNYKRKKNTNDQELGFNPTCITR